jgi:hydrophobic/amphiphilic exporter-1 (mainly G- bacteria), HAE1 family
MSFLARLSLKNRSLIALATVAILLIGAFVIPTLKQELFPSLDFPAISVVTLDAGASPTLVEHDVTNPLEQSIQGIVGIQQLTSYSNEGVSIIVVQYNFGTDINRAQQTLTQHINQAQASLPSGITPQVQTFSVNSLPVIQLAVTSSEDPVTLAAQVKQDIVPVLQGIDGVASANVTGVQQQIVAVTLDLKKVQSAGLTVSQIEGVLQANNIILPAGQITSNGQTLPVQVGNTFNSIDDLKHLVVGMSVPRTSSGSQVSTGTGTGTGTPSPLPTGTPAPTVKPAPITLGEVAKVEQTLAPSTSITRTNGKPSIGIAITKTNDGNTVSISQAIQEKLPSLQNTLGHGAKVFVVFDQSPFVRSSVNGLVSEGLIGAGFAILVILVFLFSLRSTLVIAISIPLSIVIALIGLWVGNLSLNILTLGGLTIAIGRVVDDSIVVLENIQRHLGLEGNKDKQATIISAVREVAGAVTASTITTVAVFLPIAFAGGFVGELFSSFAITVTIALLASLFVSLTIIPVLAYWFLKVPKASAQQGQKGQPAHEKMTLLERGYVPLVRWVTTHRLISIAAALVIFFGSIALVPLLGTNFFDNSSQNTFTITQTLPASSSLQQTDQAAQQVEAVLANVQGVQTYQMTIGSSGSFASSFSGGSGSNSATYAVTTDPNADQVALQQTVQARLHALTGVGTITLSAASQGFNSSNLAVNVQASDDQTLRAATQLVLDAVKQAPNTTDVSSNLADASPLINVQVDPSRALLHGLTAAQVGQELRGVYSGTTVTKITIGGEQQDVNIQLGTPANTVQGMQDLLIPAPTGNVRLGDIAVVTQINGPTQITHLNAARTATVSATVTSSNVGAVSADVQQRINKLSLPAGATVSLGGVTASQSQAFQGLALALIIAILLVYLVMVATFRSIVQPLILLVSIPFAATGSILLLLATHTALGVPALIGLLMLVGIVVTNAIVLLDLVNQYRAKGLDARSAVVEGGRRRLRPILMTAIATILALLPMALGLSKAGVFIAGPLAIVVIGGLTSSTILTLLLVPTLYVIVEDIRGRLNRGRTTPPAPPASRENLESGDIDEQELEPQVKRARPYVEERTEPVEHARTLAAEQAESAPNRSRALLGLTLALIAHEAQQPEADPQILATLSSAAAGRYPQTWSEEQAGRAVARDLLEPLSINLLASSTGNGRGHAHENNRRNV